MRLNNLAFALAIGMSSAVIAGDTRLATEPLRLRTAAVESQELFVPIPDADIRFPVVPVLVEPDSSREPGPVSVLSSDQWFVITSAAPLLVIQSPVGFVTIEEDSGPIKVKGVFADGIGRVETRTYAEPHIYFISAKQKGETEIIAIPVGVKDEQQIVRQTLTVVGPRPPPDPQPDPEPQPEPEPDPAPIPGGNRVLILYESSDLSTYPPAQAELITSGVVRDYLDKVCAKGPDGKTPEYRIWDKDVDLTNVSDVWKEAVKMQRDGLPWLIVSNGKTGYSGPLPSTQSELMAKLKQYLGE